MPVMAGKSLSEPGRISMADLASLKPYCAARPFAHEEHLEAA
jgi:hypothetical protein